MLELTKETWGKNEREVITFNGKKWLNETNIKDQLKHSNLAAITLQYSSDLRKQRQKLQDCGNHQPCRRSLEEDFAMQITMDCTAAPAVNFKTKLGFKSCDIICS